MCYEWEWAILQRAYAEEMERRKREKVEAERAKPTTAPPKPAESPARHELPEPV